MFGALLERQIGSDAAAFRLPDGRVVGARGAQDGAERDAKSAKILVAVKSWHALARIAANPNLGFAEAYMDGDIVFERGELFDLLLLVNRRFKQKALEPKGAFGHVRSAWMKGVRQANARSASRRNVAHHYDLSLDLYRLFLDPDLQYSCGYFPSPDTTLEQAQLAKKRHIAAKLHPFEGARVLDIGCGFGGMALTLAREFGCKTLGVTLSEEQFAYATLRAEAEHLEDRARFSLTDYRDVEGRFDRIVSVGMFEHVGVRNYPAYFGAVARLLQDRGVALIHTIGRSGPALPTHPFIDKYIFPGGYIPSLSDIAPHLEQSGLILSDMEVLRLHYADTLAAWRRNFAQNRARIAELYDERFCRMWEFYLAGSEAGFRTGDLVVFQVQLIKQHATLPVTRNYMYERPLLAESPAAVEQNARS